MEYIRSISAMAPVKLSSTESALLLREVYCETYLPPLPDDSASAGGAMRSAPSGDDIIQSIVDDLITEYTEYEIYENLKISFQEYMETPEIVRKSYLVNLEAVPARRAAELEKLKAEMSDYEQS